ncbi:hypothetical protein E4T56_gene10957 [Termitomyces sp. T112]|nr:hypothetical protein E4T56_gene10957 [Termitomyces sp. T112]
MPKKISKWELAVRIPLVPILFIIHRKQLLTSTQLQNLEKKMRDVVSKYEEHVKYDELVVFDAERTFGNKIHSFAAQVAEKRERAVPLLKEKGNFFCMRTGLWQEIFNFYKEVNDFDEELDEYIHTFLDLHLKAKFKRFEEICEARRAAMKANTNNEEDTLGRR